MQNVTCTGSTYKDSNNNCQNCVANCSSCTGPNQCSTCMSGYTLNSGNTSCSVTNVTCSSNQYKSNNVCYNCVSNCINCNNGTSCNSCSSVNGSNSYFSSGSNTCRTCTEMFTTCKTCSATSCTVRCQSGYKYKNNACSKNSSWDDLGTFWKWFLPIAAALCYLCCCLALLSSLGGAAALMGKTTATTVYQQPIRQQTAVQYKRPIATRQYQVATQRQYVQQPNIRRSVVGSSQRNLASQVNNISPSISRSSGSNLYF